MNISVVTPMYNAKATLAECLTSLAACPAGREEVEFILIDDASTDGTRRICEEYALADSRFRLISKEINSGVSDSRNLGIEAAAGEYLFFLDADDFLYEGAWEGILDRTREARYDLIAFAYDTLFPDGGRKAERFPIEGRMSARREDLYATLLSTPMLNPCWGSLLRRRTARRAGVRFQKGLRTCEDAIFMIDFAQAAESCLLVNESVMAYRILTGSAMRSRDALGKLADFSLLYARRNRLVDSLSDEAFRRMAFRQYFSVITALLLGEAAGRELRGLWRAYREILQTPPVPQIAQGVSPKGIASPYKRLERLLLKGDAAFLLALYFRLKSRFIGSSWDRGM